MPKDYVVGLDIGTTKVCTIVAEVSDDKGMEIVGLGTSASAGIRKGVVVDIENAAAAIRESVVAARTMAGFEFSRAVVGVTGEHVASLNSRGLIAITHANREITADDVMRVQDQSKVIVLPPDREIIHAIPRYYSIDGQRGVRNPMGMCGMRLEVETHIVTGAVTFLQNVAKCVQRAGLELICTVLEPIATAEAVLLQDEKDLGVALADIGGGTTDIAVFADGDICYSSAVAIGGSHVSRDVAVGLRTSIAEAERVKKIYKMAETGEWDEDGEIEMADLPGYGTRRVSAAALADIVEPRMRELFSAVKQEILKSGYYNLLPAGVVLSGGGSQLAGVTELCERTLGIPARIGVPRMLGSFADTLRSPIYATAVGLVQYGLRNHQYSNRPVRYQSILTQIRNLLARRMAGARTC